MSNNTHVKKVTDHIKEQNAIQQAKSTDNAKQPVDAVKAPVDANPAKAEDKPVATESATTPVNAKQAKIDAIIATKRKSDEDWKFILGFKGKEGFKHDKDIAEYFKVTVSNIHQKRNKLKKDDDKEEAKLSTNSLVEDAKKLLAGIDEELKAFDDGILEAMARVENAKADRAKIEAKTKKFNMIIEAFSADSVEEVTEEKAKVNK